jgi:hypothetical protein
VWLPEVVLQIEFLERTGADHLRHTKFVGLRNDKDRRRLTQGSDRVVCRKNDGNFSRIRRFYICLCCSSLLEDRRLREVGCSIFA